MSTHFLVFKTMQEFVRNTTRGFTPGYVGSPPPHIHPRQTETFTVLRGKMGYNLAGAFGEVEEGQSVTITPGKACVSSSRLPF